VSNARYSNAQPIPAIVASLRSLYAVGHHSSGHDTVSLLSRSVDVRRLLSSAQVTDTYLIAQAAAIGTRLATFDTRITSVAVPDAADSMFQIP
jgi:predicted nucleic acid-binding protein